MSKMQATGQLLLALAIGTCGGAVFASFNIPLAWMLGSLIFCTIAAISGAPISTPGWTRPPVIVVIGLMLGANFSPDIFDDLVSWSFTVGGLVAYLLAGGLVCVGYLRHVAGYDRATAFYSAMPGGLGEMVVLGEENGADVRTIVLAHSSRILIVVSALPLVMTAVGFTGLPARQTMDFQMSWSGVGFGWAVLSAALGVALGHVLRLPAKFLVGPMLVSAVVHVSGLSDFTPPTPLVNLAQIGLGVAIGCRFRNADMRLFLPVFLHSGVISALMLSITLAFALALGAYTGMNVLQVLLAYAPGGLTEMGLIAVALHLDVAFVATHHLLRVVIIIAAAQAIGVFGARAKAGKDRLD